MISNSLLFPAALLSFTLLLQDFLQRQGMDWEKVRQAGILSGGFWEFWHMYKRGGSTATGNSTPVHMLLAYHDMYNHVTVQKRNRVTVS
jgi:hypothetical protein